jgi:hypothetical protein
MFRPPAKKQWTNDNRAPTLNAIAARACCTILSKRFPAQHSSVAHHAANFPHVAASGTRPGRRFNALMYRLRRSSRRSLTESKSDAISRVSARCGSSSDDKVRIRCLDFSRNRKTFSRVCV